MDNICHTLVGAALAESGLKRRTSLGTATLMIAANFPDVDVIAVPLGHSLGFRRGATHGIPALVILPFVLAGIMLLWHRWRSRPGERPDAMQLVLLSAIGIVTHPFLDWLNTYGMRWLMPVDGTWSYGDTLFIVDPWIWMALGLGVWLSRRGSHSTTPARMSLAGVALYIAVMGTMTPVWYGATIDALLARGIAADTVVVEPVFANPVQRRVIYQWQGSYHLATMKLVPSRGLTEPWHVIPLNANHPAVTAANATDRGLEYHSWTRLPYYVIEEARDTTFVTIGDARYTLDGRSSWASVRIPVVRSPVTAMAACPPSTHRRHPCAS